MTTHEVPPGVPGRPPAAAAEVFAGRLVLAERYAALLADSGVGHGLIGPREVSRLWDRHLLNCAVMHHAIAPGRHVVDIGSGAGLPGLALAVVRPDLRLTLVEPMLRRTIWLEQAVEGLGLDNVTVRRGRAQEQWGELTAPVVTARAVARLAELCRWCLPLLEPHGSLLALKGATARQELEADGGDISRYGAVSTSVEEYGAEVLSTATTVVRITVGRTTPAPPADNVARHQGRRRGGRAPRKAKRPR